MYKLAVLTQKVKQASCVVSSGEHSLEQFRTQSLEFTGYAESRAHSTGKLMLSCVNNVSNLTTRLEFVNTTPEFVGMDGRMFPYVTVMHIP